MPERYRGNLAKDILEELKRASKGEDLTLSSQAWMERFSLDGNEPDGRTLMERFVDGRNIFTKARILFRDIDPAFKDMVTLVGKLGVNRATPQEELLAQNLANIAVRQIEREGDICPGASFLAATTYAVRPEYFPEELHPQLRERLREVVNTLGNTNEISILDIGNAD